MINRRGFIKSLLAFTVARHSLGGFFHNEVIHISPLFGIPYHQSNASTGTWLGFSRVPISKELIDMITLLEKDKKENPLTLQINPLQSDINPNTRGIISDIQE